MENLDGKVTNKMMLKFQKIMCIYVGFFPPPVSK